MKKLHYLPVALAASTMLLTLACQRASDESDAASSPIKTDEEVIFFPTNARYADGQWRIPVHGWIFEPERESKRRQLFVELLTAGVERLPVEGANTFLEERIRLFLVDNERGKRVAVEAGGAPVTLPASEPDGHFRGELSFSGEAAQWTRFRTVAEDPSARTFEGFAQLLGETGLSVVSDIDDTIKVSEVLDKKRLAERTFLMEFEAVPGMAAAYRTWLQQQEAAFHYVSASPWQLYPSLAEFIEAADFPRGSLHLRPFRLKDASGLEFIGSSKKYKIATIGDLLEAFPQRHFVLVGDSGEADPEVYGKIARKYEGRVRHIFIRRVEGADNGDARFAEDFDDLPPALWTVFGDAAEIEAGARNR